MPIRVVLIAFAGRRRRRAKGSEWIRGLRVRGGFAGHNQVFVVRSLKESRVRHAQNRAGYGSAIRHPESGLQLMPLAQAAIPVIPYAGIQRQPPQIDGILRIEGKLPDVRGAMECIETASARKIVRQEIGDE